jgi:hypothetical protein
MSRIKKFIETNPLVQHLRGIYRALLPKKIRSQIERFLFEVSDPALRRKVLQHFQQAGMKINEEEQEVLNYLTKKEFSIFPYEFADRIRNMKVEIFADPVTNLKYVINKGKKLFFIKTWNEERIKTAYKYLLIEQENESPHCYLGGTFSVNKGDVICDVGAAEGIFALNVIDLASEVYLFEADEGWIEALQATFAPWQEKVKIINKWVAEIDNEKYVSLNKIFADGRKVDFLKVDVDGFEARILAGAERLLVNRQGLKIALCTYHRQEDFETFSRYLEGHGFALEHSRGYMIFNWGEIKPPYLRRGVLRASKQ